MLEEGRGTEKGAHGRQRSRAKGLGEGELIRSDFFFSLQTACKVSESLAMVTSVRVCIRGT
jgi:hypothetical protein